MENWSHNEFWGHINVKHFWKGIKKMGKQSQIPKPYAWISPEKIKTICLISAPAMGLASYAYDWAGPASAALGFVGAVLNTHSLIDINREYITALDNALRKTRQRVRSVAHQEILDELEGYEDNPNTLSEAIEKTEAFQTKYCTKSEVQEILAVFDPIFREEVAKSKLLYKYSLLNTGDETLKKLKDINNLFLNTNKKLDDIHADTQDTAKEIKKANTLLNGIKSFSINCMNCFAFLLLSMAVFLGMGTFIFQYENDQLIAAPVALVLSDFLYSFLEKNHYAYPSLLDGFTINLQKQIANNYDFEKAKRYMKLVVTAIVPILMSCSCFWLILSSVGYSLRDLLQPTIGLICGQFVSIFLKGSKLKDTQPDFASQKREVNSNE